MFRLTTSTNYFTPSEQEVEHRAENLQVEKPEEIVQELGEVSLIPSENVEVRYRCWG
jgi:hypothetical protein